MGPKLKRVAYWAYMGLLGAVFVGLALTVGVITLGFPLAEEPELKGA